MTTAYDRKLVKNLLYSLSSCVADMVVAHSALAVVDPPLFWDENFLPLSLEFPISS